MLPRTIAGIIHTPPNRTLWTVLGALVVVQIAVFWMLCSHQVRKAEERDANRQVERRALADCLQYIPRSTMSSCAVQGVAHADAASVSSAAVTNSLVVGYVR